MTLEAVVQSCSVKKVFLEISQNSLENTSARVSFLIKLQASGGTELEYIGPKRINQKIKPKAAIIIIIIGSACKF